MSLYCKLIFFVFYITITQQSIYNDIKDNVISFLDTNIQGNQERESKKVKLDENAGDNPETVYNEIKENVLSFIQRSMDKSKSKGHSKNKNPIHDISNFIDHTSIYNTDPKGGDEEGNEFRTTTSKREQPIKRNLFRIDPVLNSLRKSGKTSESESSLSSSSSLELPEWKDEWREHWIKKKLEAINASRPRGDVVNMVAARPWGVPCGDPNQHDMPWGTCMLPMECEAEYRIYRGDYFCGRTQFVCCALELNTYDMYQGFDVSFADSSLSTDSEERRDRFRGSTEKRRRERRKERRRRRKDRRKRKRKIRKNIKKIVKEIRRILNRSYKNGTIQRKRKTKQLKKFIKSLKKQYRKDRQSVKDIHETEMMKIDTALKKKLHEIRDINRGFLKNDTFREIIMNGTINKQGARMLLEAYPELSTYIDARRTGGASKRKDYLEYDIEYGMLYY